MRAFGTSVNTYSVYLFIYSFVKLYSWLTTIGWQILLLNQILLYKVQKLTFPFFSHDK